MLDRRGRDVVAHGLGKPFEALGTILADPGDGRGGQMHAEEVDHQGGQTLFRQQLIVQQIQHEGADPLAVLHRRGHPFGERRLGLRPAGCATAAVCPMFSDGQRLRFGEVEDLAGAMARHHGLGQRLAAPGTDRWKVLDGGITDFRLAQRLTRMALLSAGLLARWFP